MAMHKPYLPKFVLVRRLSLCTESPQWWEHHTGWGGGGGCCIQWQHTSPGALKSKIIRDIKRIHTHTYSVHAHTHIHTFWQITETPPASSLYIVHGYQATLSSVFFHVCFHLYELCVLWVSGCAEFVWVCGCLPVSEEELWHRHATVNFSLHHWLLSSHQATEGLREGGGRTTAKGVHKHPIKV